MYSTQWYGTRNKVHRESKQKKKNLVVERRKLLWKNQHDDETFNKFMTEMMNLAATCEFGELCVGIQAILVLLNVTLD